MRTLLLLLLFPVLAFAGAPTERRVIDPDFKPADVEKIKVAFFDADSTLRVSISGSVSANGPKDVMLLPFMGPRLKKLADEGFLIWIVSNQQGIEFKHVTHEIAAGALAHTVALIRAEGGMVHGFDYAEDGVNRKPGAGMKTELEKSLRARFGEKAKIDLSRSFMVGDSAYKKGVDVRPDGKPGTHFSNADRLFAETIGVPFQEAAIFFGWREHGIDVFTKTAEVDAFVKGCLESPACRESFRPENCRIALIGL